MIQLVSIGVTSSAYDLFPGLQPPPESRLRAENTVRSPLPSQSSENIWARL